MWFRKSLYISVTFCVKTYPITLQLSLYWPLRIGTCPGDWHPTRDGLTLSQEVNECYNRVIKRVWLLLRPCFKAREKLRRVLKKPPPTTSATAFYNRWTKPSKTKIIWTFQSYYDASSSCYDCFEDRRGNTSGCHERVPVHGAEASLNYHQAQETTCANL